MVKFRWSVGTDHPKKTRKMDLRAGYCRGAKPANSPGYPKMEGFSLRKIERKIRWSVGTGHPKKFRVSQFRHETPQEQKGRIGKVVSTF